MYKFVTRHLCLSLLILCLGAVSTAMMQGVAASSEQGSPWSRYQMTGSGLEGVDAVAANDAWAVGSDGLLAHWDGGGWRAYDNSKLGTFTIYSVEMLTSSQAWATAGSGQILRYDGSVWAQEPTNLSTTTLYDVSMVTATDGWAVGSSGRFADYDGTTWTQVQPGGTLTTTLYGIDMVSSSLGWAVGGASDQSGILGKIARYNGSTWVDAFTYNRIFYDVDMIDATYGWAVGQGGTLLEWNGTNWTPYGSPPSAAVNLQGVSVVSRTDAWAVGSRNAFSNDLWHWDGTNWTAVLTPNGAPLAGVKMIASGDGWVVGDRGTVYRYDGTNWQISNTHWTTNGFYGLDFLNPNDGWAVGVLNTSPPAYGLQHWNGSGWEIYQPPNFGTTMYDVGMAASNDVWAVGTSGYIFHWDGAAWSRVTSPNVSLYALSVISSSDAWAVGTSGNIVHYDGTAWANYTSPTTSNLWSIDMVNENEGWAGGISGLMLHYQNGTWTRIQPNPAAYTLEGIHMLNANEGWAVGYNGTILHYMNGTWTPQTSPTTVNLLNVHMLNSNEGWAVGVGGTMLHYLNGTWTQVINPTGRNLRDVHVFSTSDGWAVGESPGTKLRLGELPQITPTPGMTATATATHTQAPSTSTSTPSSTVTPASSSTVIFTATSTSTSTSTPTVTTSSTVTITCEPAWRVVSSPNPGSATESNVLYSVAAVSSNDIWAVGSYYNASSNMWRTLTLHWDGTQWTHISSPNVGTLDNTLYGVAALSGNDLWAVGSSRDAGGSYIPLTMRWNGTQWAIVAAPPAGTDSELMAVTAVSANNVWSVGWADGQTLTMRWNGTQWLRMPSPSQGNSNTLRGVAAISTNDIWAVGYSSDVALTMHWNGSAWSIVPNPNIGTPFSGLFGVSATSSNDVWAVGYRTDDISPAQTLVLRWDGGTWNVILSANAGTGHNFLNAVAPVSANEVWAVGYYYQDESTTRAMLQRWNGFEWSLVPAPNPGTHSNVLFGVEALGSEDVYAVGTYSDPSTSRRTLIERYNNPCVTPTPTNTRMPSATSTPCAITFTDVSPGHTFYENIRCLACRGIISGYSDDTFRPNNQVTRGQLAKMVSNAAGFSEPVTGQTFQDVPPSNTFYEWIERLTTRGYMTGYVCGGPGEPCINNMPYFRPQANATRGQTSKIVANAAGFTEPPVGQTFQDVPPTHTFYAEILRLASRNVMQGYPCGRPFEPCVPPNNRPYFRPGNDVTRGQSAKIVANTFYPDCVTP